MDFLVRSNDSIQVQIGDFKIKSFWILGVTDKILEFFFKTGISLYFRIFILFTLSNIIKGSLIYTTSATSTASATISATNTATCSSTSRSSAGQCRCAREC